MAFSISDNFVILACTHLQSNHCMPDTGPMWCFVWMAFHGSDRTYPTTQILPALRSQGDDYNHIMVESLADRLAEAFAEKLHQIVRKDLWGYAPNEDLTTEDLLKVKYQGEPLETDLHHCQHHAKVDNTYVGHYTPQAQWLHSLI